MSCVCACMCGGCICVCVGERTTSWVSSNLPPCLRQRLLLFAVVHVRLAASWALEESPASASHRPIRTQGLQTCTSVPVFIWALEIWTQILTLGRQCLSGSLRQETCHLSLSFLLKRQLLVSLGFFEITSNCKYFLILFGCQWLCYMLDGSPFIFTLPEVCRFLNLQFNVFQWLLKKTLVKYYCVCWFPSEFSRIPSFFSPHMFCPYVFQVDQQGRPACRVPKW